MHDDGDPLWLVLDCYSAHGRLAMKEYAEELGTHLLLIYVGLTDEMQRLDRPVFGVMKAHGRRM
jgi:hypothetical protein